jgi:ferritin
MLSDLAVSSRCEAPSLPGFAAWFRAQSGEEWMHAMKFFDYLKDRDADPRLEAVPAPAAEYATATDAFGAALANEQAVTQSIHQIYGLAVEEKDFASQSFLNWFVTEQVEEENTVKSILGWLKRIGESGQGLFLLDRGLAQTRRPRTSADLDTSAWAWSPPTAMHANERLLRASSSLC